ncbi:hypothetical protein HNE05_02535 [Aquipseudomonas campi]|uniref:Uncharacterized protein n=1 Tax=Aquipseudomonas campi TaxID=2731681 RepID=A0A6M8F4Z0_9GAMM|nr:hypothetical protein [Pseudomonas campi]QKE62281.1 hypothetical protein HNE05_02535 [Pseudomonas campi]
MEQGSLSDSCYYALTQEERDSLSVIREHYSRKQIFKFDVERALLFIDCSYEAMGKSYRDRINQETKIFGRYDGALDGVFLMIADALRLYDESFCFFDTPKEALNRPSFPRHSPSSGNSAFQTPLAIAA